MDTADAWVSNAGPGGAKLVNTRADVLIGKFAGSVTVIDTDFQPTSFSPIENSAFKWPLGMAIDTKNNAWVVELLREHGHRDAIRRHRGR